MIQIEKNKSYLGQSINTRFELVDATSNGKIDGKYVSQEIRRIFEPIQSALQKKSIASINKQVEYIVLQLMQSIVLLPKFKIDITNIPSFCATYLEDGTFLMEWLSTNYRIGFVIDENPKDSIWYLVSKGETTDSNDSGNLSGDDMDDIIIRLVSYVAINS